jgi:ABC-2 type transport system permease protein
VALFGLLPRLAVASWGALAVCVLVALVGASTRLDQRVLDLSPFTHVPRAPGAAIAATPLAWLAAAAVVLAAAGLAGLRRRDLPA